MWPFRTHNKSGTIRERERESAKEKEIENRGKRPKTYETSNSSFGKKNRKFGYNDWEHKKADNTHNGKYFYINEIIFLFHSSRFLVDFPVLFWPFRHCLYTYKCCSCIFYVCLCVNKVDSTARHTIQIYFAELLQICCAEYWRRKPGGVVGIRVRKAFFPRTCHTQIVCMLFPARALSFVIPFAIFICTFAYATRICSFWDSFGYVAPDLTQYCGKKYFSATERVNENGINERKKYNTRNCTIHT